MKLFRKSLVLVTFALILVLGACSKDDKIVDSGEEVEIDDTEINDDTIIQDDADTNDEEDEAVASDE